MRKKYTKTHTYTQTRTACTHCDVRCTRPVLVRWIWSYHASNAGKWVQRVDCRTFIVHSTDNQIVNCKHHRKYRDSIDVVVVVRGGRRVCAQDKYYAVELTRLSTSTQTQTHTHTLCCGLLGEIWTARQRLRNDVTMMIGIFVDDWFIELPSARRQLSPASSSALRWSSQHGKRADWFCCGRPLAGTIFTVLLVNKLFGLYRMICVCVCSWLR